MNLAEKLKLKFQAIEEEQNKPVAVVSKTNCAGPGKKLCKCGNYIGARTQVCKICNHIFNSTPKQQELSITQLPIIEVPSPEFIIPENPEYCYEHLRLDTWEKEQAERIIAKKDILNENKDERFFAPTGWRCICKTLDQVMIRVGIPWNLNLKVDLNRIIVKCIPTNNFKPGHNPRLGMLQEMIVVELIDI